MTEQFERIKNQYAESFRVHGDSPASLLTPKGRNELRFRAIDPFVLRRGARVLDYGCGLGYLYQYLVEAGCEIEYFGVDILPEFIDACREKYPSANFMHIDADEDVDGMYDVVFSSGVFNLCTSTDTAKSKEYALHRIEKLFSVAGDVLVCDFLSSFVDFQQADAQHFSVGEIADFCVTKLGRRFQFRHDLLPYEFTMIAWKDSEIKRPENIYEVDI
ncbi:class I SAM-dependent methyltransferase [Pseudohongiella sp.]|uniref:Methyltransferase domain-containing protein n=1 Tax=marine sediment metagenome TaxID=412755 RepID=A0A0F9W6B3_9ZZZZ|nr:class I SAM-dependent methyltransferase [Pseudohongiella sp.]HDZ08448.1 class I SAM-dependent methyltransferase [Pseudohongiella sp.]